MDDYQEQDARRLLAPLAGEPAGPTAVDIRRAVADGRRQLRTRRVAGVGMVAAVTALVAVGVPVALGRPVPTGDPPPLVTGTAPPQPSPTGPTAPTACELEHLPVPDGAPDSLVTGGDPTGRFILGSSYHGAGQMQVLIWGDGEPVPVDIPGYDASLVDANAHGVAVGDSFASAADLDSRQAWIYRDGHVTRLPGENVSAVAVNDAGVVVGSQFGPDQTSVPVVWRSPAAEPEPLALPGAGWSAEATAVDVDGTVVGSGAVREEFPDPPAHSFVWLPDGTRQELPWPTIDGQTASGFGAGSIQGGVVTGHAREVIDDSWQFHPFRYDLRSGEFTPLAGQVPIAVEEWSATGWVVGHTTDGLMLVAGPRLVELPYPKLPVDPDDRFGNLPVVRLVSDDGRTIAGQVFTDDGYRAVVWRCR